MRSVACQNLFIANATLRRATSRQRLRSRSNLGLSQTPAASMSLGWLRLGDFARNDGHNEFLAERGEGSGQLADLGFVIGVEDAADDDFADAEALR